MSVGEASRLYNGLGLGTVTALQAQTLFAQSIEKASADLISKAESIGVSPEGDQTMLPPNDPGSTAKPRPAQNDPANSASSTESGDRVYPGPVKVQSEIEPYVEQKNFIEGGIVETSGIKYSPGKGWLTEFKTIGTATESRLQAGLKFKSGEEFVSAPNQFEFVASTLDWLSMNTGIDRAALAVSAGYKSEDNLVSTPFSWTNGPGLPEANAKSEKFFTKIFFGAKGDIFDQPFEISSEAETKTERKVSYGAEPGSFKSKWDATPLKFKFIPTNVRQIIPDPRVLTDGTVIDRTNEAGEIAYQQNRFISTELPENGSNFYIQQEVGGASNLALDVPDFSYRGDGAGSETVTLTAYKDGWFGPERDEIRVTRSIEDPGKISLIEQNGRAYVPVNAVSDWLAYQGETNSAAFGDLKNITPDILLQHNEGRVREVIVEDANGQQTPVKVFEEGDVVNTGYATVEHTNGVIRAPHLEHGASQAKFEFFWSQVRVSVADNIEPGSVDAQGNIDSSRITSKVATYGFGEIVDTAAQIPLDLAEGGLRLAASLTEAGKNPGNDWVNGPAVWVLDKSADGIGWANDKVGKAVSFFTDQPRMAHNYTFIKQPTDEVLAPALNERYEALTQQADNEGWSKKRLTRETGKLLNRYHHQVLDALDTGRIPTEWNDNAPATPIADLESRMKQAMTE